MSGIRYVIRKLLNLKPIRRFLNGPRYDKILAITLIYSRSKTEIKCLNLDIPKDENELVSTLRNIDNILHFLSILNTFMELNNIGRIIITGGYAIEYFTNYAYRTGDVDIIVLGNVDFVKKVLEKIGEKIARVYEISTIKDKVIDIVSTIFIGKKDPVKVNICDKYWIYFESPEDLIITYLNACKYWQSDIDCEKVAMLLLTFWNNLDMNYIVKRIEKENTFDKFNEIYSIVKEFLSKYGLK